MHGKRCTFFWLFYIHCFISAFTFGGGYVVVPMIRRYFVEGKSLFSEEELMEMAAVAQSTPGAIAVNLAALSGLRCAGPAGAAVSCAASVTPPLLILGVISLWYGAFASNPVVAAVLGGMQAGAAALIVDLTVDMCAMVLKKRSLLLTLMIPGSFTASFVFGVNAALILLICCGLCIFRAFYLKKKAAAPAVAYLEAEYVEKENTEAG